MRLIRNAVLLLAPAMLAGTVQAQGGGSVRFNLAAGLALATSDFGDRNESGYSLVAGIGMTQPGSPISFRAEGIYNEFNPKFGGGKATAGGITGNAIYELSSGPTPTFTPYAIGGIGYFSTKEPRFTNANQTNVGWNLGGGIRFPLSGFSAYVEARYHSVSNAGVKFAPIVFGLLF
jgi:hypothetical protein